MCLVWQAHHASINATPIVATIVAAGGTVGYDYQLHPEFKIVVLSRTATGSRVVRSVLGDDIYAIVNAVVLDDPKTSDADVANLHNLPDLLHVSLNGNGVTDACVGDLLRIQKLQTIALRHTGITPEEIRHLSSCQSLPAINLHGSSVTDQHLEHL